MRVPRQLDRDHSGVVDLAQRREGGIQIELTLAERQVLVRGGQHVVGLDVAQQPARGAQGPDHSRRLDDHAVPEIDGQAQVRGVAEAGAERESIGHGLDEHAGFGLEGEGDARVGGERGELEQTLLEQHAGLLDRDVVGHDSAPQRHAVGIEDRGDLDGRRRKAIRDPASRSTRVGRCLRSGSRR